MSDFHFATSRGLVDQSVLSKKGFQGLAIAVLFISANVRCAEPSTDMDHHSKIYGYVPSATKIVYYFRDDSASLKAYSTTSRSFRTSCRRHLFSAIHLSGPVVDGNSNCRRSSTSCERLYTVLHNNPELLRYIRSLNIVNNLQWILDEPTFPKLLHLVADHASALNRFVFDMEGCNQGGHWSAFLDEYQSALYSLLSPDRSSSSALELVSLRNVCALFPPAVLGGCPRLRHLGFNGDLGCLEVLVRLLSMGDNPPPFAFPDVSSIAEASAAVTRRIPLDSVAFNDAMGTGLRGYLSDQRFPLDITRIRILYCDGVGEDTLFVLQALSSASAQTLLVLQWDVPHYYTPPLAGFFTLA